MSWNALKGVPLELEIADSQRSALGLDEGDTVRVLSSTPSTVLLERVRPTGAPPLPWDRDLILTADVRAFSLADVLHLIHSAAKSGFLLFEHGDCAKAVYLHAGEVVFASSNQTVDRLGPVLMRAGMLTPEQYREADTSFRPPGPFGRLLVERGYLSPRELWNGVRVQVEEIVRSLFAYTAGSVLFFEGEVHPDNVVRLSLPTQRLVAEGLKRRDELLRFVARLEDPRIRLEFLQAAGPASRLGGTERAIRDALEQESHFPAICRLAGVDAISAARTLRVLREMGALRIQRSDAGRMQGEPAPARPGEDEAVRACVRDHVKLLAELVAPVVAVEGAVGPRERLQQVVSEAASRHREILGGLAVGAGGAIDPEELVARALRFPGDREPAVRDALGELVAYLEFELLNHPAIEEPEQFLEGIAPLRSRI